MFWIQLIQSSSRQVKPKSRTKPVEFSNQSIKAIIRETLKIPFYSLFSMPTDTRNVLKTELGEDLLPSVSSRPFKLARLLVPGVFLLLLGLGNIGVGVYKGGEYQRVLEELSELKHPPRLINASPLMRLQMSRNKTERIEQRRSKASARKDFYNLVTFGGKLILGLSFILIFVAVILSLASRGGEKASPT